jgi:23S rRNA (uracil-5-)-methyltransferase RumA
MKYGDETILKITSVDKKGRGTGKVMPTDKQGKERDAVVPFALPGEEIRGVCVGRRNGKLKLEVKEVLTPSPDRIKPPCPHALTCGGCAWQHLDYPAQVELKRNQINQAFGRAGLPPVREMIPAESPFRYRNRMDFCAGWGGELGLKKPGRWNAYVDLGECHLVSPGMEEVFQRAKKCFQESGIEHYDAKKHTGHLRYLVIREGVGTGERMATVLTMPGELPRADQLVAALSPLCTTIYHGVSQRFADLSYADDFHLLHGKPEFEEEVLGKRFVIHPNAFFQTNTVMATKLVEQTRDYLAEAGPRSLLDLYCGTGLFGICLADTVEHVFGVEIEDAAVQSARANAERNGVTNIRFETAKAEDLIWSEEQPDAVIIDPPRAGLHSRVIRTLLEKRPPTLVYVSCNYQSLARDWADLSEGYDWVEAKAFDLFPHTPHVETVALLKAKPT